MYEYYVLEKLNGTPKRSSHDLPITFKQDSAFDAVSNCNCHNSHWLSVSSRKLILYLQSLIRSTSTRLLICCVSESSTCDWPCLLVNQFNLSFPAICNCESVVNSVHRSKLRLSWPHTHLQPLSTEHISSGSSKREFRRSSITSTGCSMSVHSGGGGLPA